MRVSLVSAFVLPVSILVAGIARGQQVPAGAVNAAPVAAPPVEPPVADRPWAFGATMYVFFVPSGTDYVLPIITLDQQRLHLEARYSYEALRTGSAWIGYSFSGGEKLSWELRPMLGTVFGIVNALAPGYEGSLDVWKLEFYSEGEVVLDFSEASESFFYSWSELSLAPIDWLRFGLVLQRTRVYRTDREVQPGLLTGVSYGSTSISGYVLNPDESQPVVAVSAGVDFDL